MTRVIGPSRNATLQLAMSILHKDERAAKKESQAAAEPAPAKKAAKKPAAKKPAAKKPKGAK